MKNVSLSQSALFGALAPADLERILAIAIPRHLSRGETLCRKGDAAEAVYVIVRGRVRVVRDSEDGKAVVLRTLGPGDVAGELGVLHHGERTATMVVEEDCELLSIGRVPFLALLERHPSVAVQLLGSLAARIDELTNQISEFIFVKAEVRLARRLLGLARIHGRVGEEGVHIEARVSQQDLADMVGVTREYANKSLRAWEEQGLLTLQRYHLTIHRIDRLEELAADPGLGSP